MYSPKIDLAVTMALDAHGLTMRKAGRGYQASHVFAVAMIVADFEFDEDAVIAALLHDSLEDTDLDPSAIRDTFGDHVLAIVGDVTEPKKATPWRERKLAYIEQIRRSPREATRAVASADKIYNLSTMTEGLKTHGPTYWQAFNAPPDELVWYQRTVFAMLESLWRHRILDEHSRCLNAFLAAAERVG